MEDVMADRSIFILLATDFPILHDAVRTVLADAHDLHLADRIETPEEILSCVCDVHPDVVILDNALVHQSLLGLIPQLVDVGSRVLLIGNRMANEEVVAALIAGASGVIDRRSTPDLIRRSIRAVAGGEFWIPRKTVSCLIERLRAVPAAAIPAEAPAQTRRAETKPPLFSRERVAKFPTPTGTANKFGLTKRELQIVGALVEGQTNKDIASSFGLSECTVKHHLTNAFDKVGVYNRVELALFAVHHQLYPSGDTLDSEPLTCSGTIRPGSPL